MSQELSDDALQKIVDDHVARLLEHFDSVTILITHHSGEPAETCSYDGGGGNLYARIGKAQEWLTMQDQFTRSFASRRVVKNK